MDMSILSKPIYTSKEKYVVCKCKNCRFFAFAGVSAFCVPLKKLFVHCVFLDSILNDFFRFFGYNARAILLCKQKILTLIKLHCILYILRGTKKAKSVFC